MNNLGVRTQLVKEVKWLDKIGGKTLLIGPGSPWKNGYSESFNGCFRDELLNQEVFIGLEDVFGKLAFCLEAVSKLYSDVILSAAKDLVG